MNQVAQERSFEHVSVLLSETIKSLPVDEGCSYADVTLGGGGHAYALLKRASPDARLLGLDRDREALTAARSRLAEFGERVVLDQSPFSELESMAQKHGFSHFSAIIADLGVSSFQFDTSDRGFSLQHDGPIDMRMDQACGQPAYEIIRDLAVDELADVLFEYGGERASRKIARSIKQALSEGSLETTRDLAQAVERVLPRRGKLHPATRTFQALRIYTNGELDQLDALLDMAPRLLREGGMLAVISFHELEDRRVKHFVREHPLLTKLTKKPIMPTRDEILSNPRARSAKLRLAQRVADDQPKKQPKKSKRWRT